MNWTITPNAWWWLLNEWLQQVVINSQCTHDNVKQCESDYSASNCKPVAKSVVCDCLVILVTFQIAYIKLWLTTLLSVSSNSLYCSVECGIAPYTPVASTSHLFPGTWYLVGIDDKHRRRYDRVPLSQEESCVNGVWWTVCMWLFTCDPSCIIFFVLSVLHYVNVSGACE